MLRKFGVINHSLRGSASPVLMATGFVNGKRQFLNPHGGDLREMNVPTAVPNYVHIRPRGLLGTWVKYNQNYFYFYIFMRNSPTGQTRRRIFTYDSSNHDHSRKYVTFWGFFSHGSPFRGQTPPQKNLGAWIGVFKPNSRNRKTDFASFDDLCIQADENLFNKVLHNPDHVLHRLLSPVAHTSHNYNLRPRAHDRSLPERLTHLTDCNFIIRMLFYQVYWQYLIHACFIVLPLRSDSCQIHGYVMLCYVMRIIKTTASITTKFCIVIKTTECPSWVVPTHASQIQETAAILEKSKNRHTLAAVRAILTKFGTIMQFDPLSRSDR